MTRIEQRIADALKPCVSLPGSFDKRFVRDMQYWKDRDLSEKQHDILIKLLVKYRRQIPNSQELLLEAAPDRFSVSVDMEGGTIIIQQK